VFSQKQNEKSELETCQKLLTRTFEGKLRWDFTMAGQAWCAANDVFFSLYFPNVEIVDNDHWRRFLVQRRIGEAGNLGTIFNIANPNDIVAVSLGIRVASLEVARVLDELTRFLIKHHAQNTYGKILSALDSL
jgi:hypothetical protein